MSKKEKAKKVAKWAVPIRVDVDKQLAKALKLKEIRKAYEDYSGDPSDFKSGLRAYIEQANAKNSRMRKFAAYLDTTNKATVPFDAIADYFIVMGGVGTAARGIKSLAMSPGYLAYDAYYLGKTHDVLGSLGNLAYEVGSWISLGGLPHLLNHYTKQADKYAVKEASKRFLDGLEKKTVSIDEIKDKKKKRLEEKVAA